MFGNKKCCFCKHISGFRSLFISDSLLFLPPIFVCYFVGLEYSSWCPLRLVETLGGRFSFYFAAQKFSLYCLVTPQRLFNTKVK